MLAQGETPLSIIAVLREVTAERLVFWPLIIGAPWLEPTPDVPFDPTWFAYDFFEHYVDDIDEFEKVKAVDMNADWSPMQRISEDAFKACLCEILSDTPGKDWGGERSDHFASHLSLQGRRITAAFLLKGPGNGFGPMHMTHLGKRGDQLFRLASEPAELLIVQHCHEITPPVRGTLRALAVQPHHARRYCLIDGRDSFRLLTAYGLVEKALQLSASKS